MGDKEFEEYLDGKNGEENPPCQKRLLFDIVSNKLETISDLYGSSMEFLTAAGQPESSGMINPLAKALDKPFDKESIKSAKEFVSELMKDYTTSIEQMNYLISRVIGEMDEGE